MKRAYAALSHGLVRIPVPRLSADVSTVPVLVKNLEGEALVVKTTTAFRGNAGHGFPVVYATVQVLDPETGRISALIEGTMISAIRTGAGAGATTALLAQENARTVSIFGVGLYTAQVPCEVLCRQADRVGAGLQLARGSDHLRQRGGRLSGGPRRCQGRI